MKLTVKVATTYLKEWTAFRSIKKLKSDDAYHYFSVKQQGEPKEVRVELKTTGDYYEIWERRFGEDDSEWQWCDAIELIEKNLVIDDQGDGDCSICETDDDTPFICSDCARKYG